MNLLSSQGLSEPEGAMRTDGQDSHHHRRSVWRGVDDTPCHLESSTTTPR